MKEITAYGIVNYDTPTLRKSAPKLEGREDARYTGLNTFVGFITAPRRVQMTYSKAVIETYEWTKAQVEAGELPAGSCSDFVDRFESWDNILNYYFFF